MNHRMKQILLFIRWLIDFIQKTR